MLSHQDDISRASDLDMAENLGSVILGFTRAISDSLGSSRHGLTGGAEITPIGRPERRRPSSPYKTGLPLFFQHRISFLKYHPSNEMRFLTGFPLWDKEISLKELSLLRDFQLQSIFFGWPAAFQSNLESSERSKRYKIT